MTEKREELKPCPFCGAVVDDPEYGVQFKDNGYGPPPSRSVICDDCGAAGPMGYGTGRGDYPGSEVAAIAAWNRRAPVARKRPPGFSLQLVDGAWFVTNSAVPGLCAAHASIDAALSSAREQLNRLLRDRPDDLRAALAALARTVDGLRALADEGEAEMRARLR